MKIKFKDLNLTLFSYLLDIKWVTCVLSDSLGVYHYFFLKISLVQVHLMENKKWRDKVVNLATSLVGFPKIVFKPQIWVKVWVGQMTRALRPVTFCNLTSHLIAALYSPNFHFQIFDLFQSLVKKVLFL